MPRTGHSAGHYSFLETIRVLNKGAGAAYAAESLIKTGVSAGRQVEPVEYDTLEQFYESMERGDNPITDFEGKSKHFGKGVFGLRSCPFAPALRNYVAEYGYLPAFRDVTSEMNQSSDLTRGLRVGEGSAVSPFCVMHQPVRSAMTQRVSVGGQPVLAYQLGCKTFGGNKGIAWRFLRDVEVARALVETVLDEYTCCFCFRPQPRAPCETDSAEAVGASE